MTWNKTEITPELLADLKAKAEKATPGPWGYGTCDIDRDTWGVGYFEDSQENALAGFIFNDRLIPLETIAHEVNGRDNAAYIAAASPGVVLSLIARIQELEKDLGGLCHDDEAKQLVIERLEREAQWLAKYCEGEEQCPYLAFQWGETNNAPKWCNALDTIEDGFECLEDPVDCWRRVARKAVEESENAG